VATHERYLSVRAAAQELARVRNRRALALLPAEVGDRAAAPAGSRRHEGQEVQPEKPRRNRGETAAKQAKTKKSRMRLRIRDNELGRVDSNHRPPD